MAAGTRSRRIERVLHRFIHRKGTPMLEWKARILTLAISLAFVWDQITIHVDQNWNW
jgi:hypothetical protein